MQCAFSFFLFFLLINHLLINHLLIKILHNLDYVQLPTIVELSSPPCCSKDWLLQLLQATHSHMLWVAGSGLQCPAMPDHVLKMMHSWLVAGHVLKMMHSWLVVAASDCMQCPAQVCTTSSCKLLLHC